MTNKSKDKELNNILDLQIEVIEYLIKTWQITSDKFINIDKKYNIIKFIEDNYYPLHLMGIKGIQKEVEKYIKISGVR